jgi:hypothetical protein
MYEYKRRIVVCVLIRRGLRDRVLNGVLVRLAYGWIKAHVLMIEVGQNKK